jgi:hypothetical protein
VCNDHVAVFVLYECPNCAVLAFLRSIEQLRLLPAADRRKLAASIYADIKPHVGTDDYDGLRRAAGNPVIQGVSQQQDKCRSISAT